MPKLKTNKAAKKRYSYTATGKVKRTKANRRHLLANKTKRQKMNARVQGGRGDKTCEAQMKRILPYGNQDEKKREKGVKINGKSKNSKNNQSKT